MSETEDIYFQEKKKIKELEKKLASIKIRNYIYLGFIVLFFGMWSIILSNSGSNLDVQLMKWGCILGLTFGTLVGSLVSIGLLSMLMRFILSLVTVEPDEPMVSKEELEKGGYTAGKLTACSNCMLVYDARRLKCPDCGKDSERKQKKIKTDSVDIE